MDELERYLIEHQNEYPTNNNLLLREVAYERLKDAIRHANLQPGEPLSENRISKILGISRTPVREAIQLLAKEGLIEIIPGRAITVASRTIRDVIDILNIRLLLEPDLIRRAAEAISEEQIQILLDCLSTMETAVAERDRAAWSRADTTWHETLSNACPNQLLGELVLQMRNRIHRYANIDHQLRIEQLRNGTAEHRVIVQAIAAGKADEAGKLMREHLENLKRNLFDQLIYN